MKDISFTKAINLALSESLAAKEKSVCIGLGINDPKRIFGTTNGLVENFGENRIIEPPTSENALTGISLGLALNGFSVCLTHQRLDFALLSFDQIVNSIAKWNFMFNKKKPISLLIRLIVGRGWGQGPTHSQSYHSFLASIPGLNVYYPNNALSAYKIVKNAMVSAHPTIMIEHRWLHNSIEKNTNFDLKNIDINSIKTHKIGSDLTIFTYGYMVPEALKAAEFLKRFAIKIEILSIENLNNADFEHLYKSIKKTRNLLIIEPYFVQGSFLSFLLSELIELITNKKIILNSYKFVSLPFENESTSYFQTKSRYKNWKDIATLVFKQLNTVNQIIDKTTETHHDVPGAWFKGPF